MLMHSHVWSKLFQVLATVAMTAPQPCLEPVLCHSDPVPAVLLRTRCMPHSAGCSLSSLAFGLQSPTSQPGTFTGQLANPGLTSQANWQICVAISTLGACPYAQAALQFAQLLIVSLCCPVGSCINANPARQHSCMLQPAVVSLQGKPGACTCASHTLL